MKTLYRTIAVFCGMAFIVLTCAFYIQSFNFNSNQFTAVAPYLSLKSGVDITNANEQITTGNFWQVMYANNNNAVVITGDGSLKFYDNLGNNYFNYMVGSNAVAINTNLNVAGSLTVTSTNSNSYFAGTVFATNGFTAVGGVFTGNGSGLTNLSGVSSLPAGTNSGDMISYHGGNWIVAPIGQYIFNGTSTNATATNLASFVTARTSLPLSNGFSVRITGDFTASGATNSGAWTKVALFRNDAGTVSLVQSNQIAGPTAGQATNWNGFYSISGTNIQFNSIGDSAETVNWKWQGWWELLTNATQFGSGGGGAATNLTTNLVAYWTMDENISSGSRSDSTGNGSTLADRNNNIPADNVNFKLVRSASFPATSGSCLTNTDNTFTSLGANQSFTISCWIREATQPFPAVVFEKGTVFDGTHDEYMLYAPSASGMKFDVGNGTTFGSVTFSQVFSTATWYHIVVTYDAPSQKLHAYVNGAEDAGSPQTWTGGTQDTTAGLSVGESLTSLGHYFSGDVDEMGLWKRALDLGGVQALYGSGTPPSFSTFSTILH